MRFIFILSVLSWNIAVAQIDYTLSPQSNDYVDTSPLIQWQPFALKYNIDISLDKKEIFYSTYFHGGLTLSTDHFGLPPALWDYLKSLNSFYFRVTSVEKNNSTPKQMPWRKLNVRTLSLDATDLPEFSNTSQLFQGFSQSH